LEVFIFWKSLITSVSWTADSQILATGGGDGTVKLWNRDGSPISEIETNQGDK
jgi:WD40 repeat protein